MKHFVSNSQKIGELGESIVCKYLYNKGFTIIERNYTKPCGEIDIIACKDGITHFIEVKSVSCEIRGSISHETEGIQPEENMHTNKQKKMAKTILVYLASHHVLEWQCDLVCLFIDEVHKKAKIRVLDNIILEN